MKRMDELERKARAELMINLGNRKQDPFLWEHSQRVAYSALRILKLIEQSASETEQQILQVASWYHDTGWITQFKEGLLQRSEILARPMTDLQRELSAARAEEVLGALLPAHELQSICTIIRQAGGRQISNVFAQVLAEACNLDQIGPLALWQDARRSVTLGKGVEDLIKTWERQREYNYWQARIRDSLHFEPVKKIALQRLTAMEAFMATVARHIRSLDIVERGQQ
jgi:hypothetical protein